MNGETTVQRDVLNVLRIPLLSRAIGELAADAAVFDRRAAIHHYR